VRRIAHSVLKLRKLWKMQIVASIFPKRKGGGKMNLLPDKETIIFDLETTDIALANGAGVFPEIVEVGAVKVSSSLEILDTFSMIVRPNHIESFTDFSEQLIKLKPADLESAKLWKDCWRDFAEFTNYNHIKLISWGAGFDYGVLNTAYIRNRLGYAHSLPVFDAISIAYGYAMQWGFIIKNWSLANACKRFDITTEKRHRALPDAISCTQVLQALTQLDS